MSPLVLAQSGLLARPRIGSCPAPDGAPILRRMPPSGHVAVADTTRSTLAGIRLLLATVLGALACGSTDQSTISDSPPTTEEIPVQSDQAHAFDFLLGRTWRVHNRRLRDRLVGSTEWDEFEATLVGWTILGGTANIDRFRAERSGEVFHGSSLRIFDEAENEWTIYWMDSGNPHPRFQVRGRFEGGLGTFYGEEDYRGQPVQLRFRWTGISDSAARWEQAYQRPDGTWETNWVMEFHSPHGGR